MFYNDSVLLNYHKKKSFKGDFPPWGLKQILMTYLRTLQGEHLEKRPTRMMNLIAAHPEVAMTFALLGTRLKSVGTMASAP
jgi:hypothetical protein